jgi:uncharacterized membrane protein YGL010W
MGEVAFDWRGLARFGVGYAGATVLVAVAGLLGLGLPYQFPVFLVTVGAAAGALVVLSSYSGPPEEVDPGRRRRLRRALAYCAGVFVFGWAVLIVLPDVV